MRLLAFGPNRHALVGAKLKLTIGSDQSQEQQFERVLTTSNFGIAAADWEVPRKLELGEYRLKAELNDANGSNEAEALANIRISRYELPTFTVKVKPDRTYYIRGQNASIEVSGRLLVRQTGPAGQGSSGAPGQRRVGQQNRPLDRR